MFHGGFPGGFGFGGAGFGPFGAGFSGPGFGGGFGGPGFGWPGFGGHWFGPGFGGRGKLAAVAWRGINSETAHAFLAQASKFAGVLKLRKEFLEIGGLARTIMWSGTDEQKERLEEARTKILAAVTEAKQS